MKKQSSGILHAVPKGAQPAKTGGSATTYQPCGSGSRPTKSHYAIESSAPADAYTMGRSVKGALK